jgi:hypothetical protein
MEIRLVNKEEAAVIPLLFLVEEGSSLRRASKFF